MHIGVLCPFGTGHINPMATLCRALAARGHRVTFLVPADGEEKVRRFGLEHHPVARQEFPPGAMISAYEHLGTLSGRAARRYTAGMYLRVISGVLRDAPAAVASLGIEGLIIDQTMLQGRSIAEKAGIPFVTLCAALLFNEEADVPPPFTGWRYQPSLPARWRNRLGYAVIRKMLRPIVREVARHRDAWGLPELEFQEMSASPLAQLCQAPREFDYPRRELPRTMHYVGPLHDLCVRPDVPFDFSRLDGRPLVYASMGSLQNKITHAFETIAKATAGLDAQVVLSFGSADAHLPRDLPGSPITVPYAPQLDLIERASVVITHAGMNTVMESLACGVPMVAIPVTNDQPGVAARISWTRTGEVLPFGKLCEDRLRPLVRRVLEDGTYRENARRMQRAIQAGGGVSRAADIAEQALTENRVVLPEV